MQKCSVDRLVLRPAIGADQPAIVNICKTSITTTYGAFMDPEQMRLWVEGHEVEDYVARMWSHMLLAMRKDQVLGMISLDGHVIDLVWVRADLRGQGLDSTLMDQAESMLVTHHDKVELEGFALNHASMFFYKARGYTVKRRYYEAASRVDKIVMTKPLARAG